MSARSVARRIALASNNSHKAREWQVLLPHWSVQTLDMSGAPPESGATFFENALGKARHGALVAPTGTWVLGEDSGLVVEALGGAPGVRSARFAGPDASDADNVARLLAELGGAAPRQARFQCAVVCVSPAGDEFEAGGVLTGRIASEPAGASGFGYDPVFVPDGERATVAQLGSDWKRENSHRSHAARHVLDVLARCGPDDLSQPG